jgi:hypothetical protein
MVRFLRRKAGKYCLKNRQLESAVATFRESEMHGHNRLSRLRFRIEPYIAAAAIACGMFACPASAQDTSFGQRLYRDKADCQFCHGIDGDGRGDPRSPGQAANLHKTILNREQ